MDLFFNSITNILITPIAIMVAVSTVAFGILCPISEVN